MRKIRSGRLVAYKLPRELKSICAAVDGLSALVAALVRDPEAFLLVDTGSAKSAKGEDAEDGKIRINAKDIRELVASVKDLATTTRALYGVLSPTEQLDLERLRYQLTAESDGAATSAAIADTGVILLNDLLPEEKEAKADD